MIKNKGYSSRFKQLEMRIRVIFGSGKQTFFIFMFQIKSSRHEANTLDV